MTRTISPFRLGLFILVCGTIAIISLIWIGASHYFEKTHTYVTYFDESVKGLQKDAVINYRGVAVGRVASIELAPDGRLIEVQLRLRQDFLVDESIAVQLREQGLTGLRYLEIDTAPANLADITPQIDFVPPHPLICSYPSELLLLKQALEDIYVKISELDLKNLTRSWTQTAELFNSILQEIAGGIEEEDWKVTLAAVRKTAEGAAELARRLNDAVSKEDIEKGLKNLNATLSATRETSEALAKQVGRLPPDTMSALIKNMQETARAGEEFFSNFDREMSTTNLLLQRNLQQLRQLLDQMNALVQTLKDQPNRIIFSHDEPDPFKRK